LFYKIYYKLFNNKKYRTLKEQNAIQKTVKIFKNKYSSYLYEIESKIKNNKKITFLHSGHLGDLFNSPRWYFHITGTQVDLADPYLYVTPHEKIKNKIVILRTFRGRSQFINYKFLQNYKNLIFIGMKNEYEDLKQDIKNIEFYDCKNFLDMARVIKACKFFIGNKSVAYAIAEALKVPRILEAKPRFPVVQPIGKNAFDFYYQPHFEKWCSYLNKKN